MESYESSDDSMDNDDYFKIVQEYFTKEEWEKMPDIIKTRHKNAYIQYTILPPETQNLMGVPEFMKRSKELMNTKAGITNQNVTKKKEKDKEFKMPRTVTKSAPKKTRLNPTRHTKVQVNYFEEDVPSDDRYISRLNPTRHTKVQVNYFEEDVPSDDRYIFCDNCEQDCVDFCETCGMLISVSDNPVPKGTPDRAIKTAPRGTIEIKASKIHGKGAFAMRNLPKRVQFGPYEGQMCRVENINGYSWKMKDGRLIDASEETISNWLRYVNCATHISQQNIIAFQYKGEVYYRTCRNIKKGEELLVYYGVSFAQALGIEKQKYFDPEHQQLNTDVYHCKFCKIGLSTESFRDAHVKHCRFKQIDKEKVDAVACKYCKCLISDEEFRKRHQLYCRKRNQEESDDDDKENTHFDGNKKPKTNRKYSCQFCLKKFIRKQHLDSHLLNNHKTDTPNIEELITSKVHRCPHCSYQTVTISHLNKHLLVHKIGNSQMFNCDQCQFQTKYKNNLKTHIRLHTGEKFVCDVCKKEFNHKQQLDSHLFSRHRNECNVLDKISSKIHKCPICSYEAVFTTQMKSHFMVHHSDEMTKNSTKIFKCEKCFYITKFKPYLTRHVLIHSGKKAFACDLCKKNFTRKDYLFNHILSNHKDNERLLKTISHKIHSCFYCSYKSINTANIKAHMKKH